MGEHLRRTQSLFERLRANPSVALERAEVESAELPIDDDAIEDIVADGGFTPDEAMRAFWGEVGRVRLLWSVPSLSSGGIAPGGAIHIKSIFDTCFTGYSEDLVEAMVPDTDEERTHLLALRHLELRDALDWTAIRAGDDGTPRLWARFPSGRRGVDVRLSIDFGGYIHHVLETGGFNGWALLFVEASDVPAAARGALRDRFAMIRRSLDALDVVAGTNAAGEYRERLVRLERDLVRT